jgi:catechol 2,3-dioxygenase-like lactoylglutathione lyase family enzyme
LVWLTTTAAAGNNDRDDVVLHVNDVQRAKKFYTEVLGMTPYREDDGQVFLHAGRQGVALFRTEGETPLTAGNDLNHLALNVAAGSYETLKPNSRTMG